MMGALPKVMVRLPGSPPRPYRRRTLLLSLLCGLSLAGCSSRFELPQLVYLGIGTNDERIDAELLSDFQKRLSGLETGFRQIHPATRFQFSVYPDDRISDAISRRNRGGLGPDLLFINGSTARELLAKGLIDPFSADPALVHLFNPSDLNRMRTSSGQLAGLPVLIEPQVACFNRKSVPNAPSTLSELLKTSAGGHSIGLSVEIESLLWTAGSMGAIEALMNAAAGQRPTGEARQRIADWLIWLQNASDQNGVSFFANQLSLQDEFSAGRLAWITCSSTSLPRLRKSLGPALGVASLPNGPRGIASPVNRLRVLALGRSSSKEGRKRALDFSHFSVNPLVQRGISLGSQTLLPANRFVQVPVQSSEALQAMVSSQKGAQEITRLEGVFPAKDPRRRAVQGLITQLVFGEVRPQGATEELIRILLRPAR